MRSAITLGLGLWIAAAAPSLRAQMDPLPPASANSAAEQAGQTTQPATKPPAKPATQTAAKPATQAPAKPTTATKPAAQPGKPAPQAAAKPGLPAPAKPAAEKPAGKPVRKKAAAKPRAKAVEKSAGPAGARKAAAQSELKAARRDPFESLISHNQGKGGGPSLPPGPRGLQVSTLRLDGVVRAPNGMIAVVSNPQARTYFLREGDQLYDGSVEKITMDGVSFHELGKDAFGKPVERQVNKRIYSTSSGEQQ
jgi:hypothetical protein